ncbi:MAG: hypothetical protein GXY83_05055 [Rhodopirellula sp.]|nr:hypothetical protein [Rhodopirellula sp.]
MVSSVANLLDTASDDLVLRICGSSRNGQVVRIRAGKCTIGSSPQCTLRIRSRGVMPLHCLLIRGTRRTVIRRWAPDTLLNGKAFTDSELLPGDRLSVGQLELEVLPTARGRIAAPSEGGDSGCAEFNSEATQALDTQESAIAELESRRQELDSRSQYVQQQYEEIERIQGEIAEQRRRFQEELSKFERRCEALDDEQQRRLEEHHRAAKELDRQAETLNRERNELESARAALEENRQAWLRDREEAGAAFSESEQQRLEEHRRAAAGLDRQAETLNRERNELESARAALEENRQAWLREREEAEAAFSESEQQRVEEHRRAAAELDRQAETLNRERNELESARAALEENRQAWLREREEAEAAFSESEQQRVEEHRRAAEDLERQVETLNRERDVLESARAALEESRQAWRREREEAEAAFSESEQQRVEEHRRAEEDLDVGGVPWETRIPDEVEFESVSGNSPLSSLEVFRRMGTVPDFAETDEEPVLAEPIIRKSSPPPIAHFEEEDSVDSYMAQLLARSRQSNADRGPMVPKGVRESVRQSSAAPIQPTLSQEAPGADRPDTPQPKEFSPRTVAPEKHLDFAAMRDLANFSAQTAIHHHARRKIDSATRTKLFLTAAALMLSGGLLWAYWARAAGDATLYGALASLSIALVWGAQYAILTGRRLLGRAKHPQWESSEGTVTIAPLAQALNLADAATEDDLLHSRA